MEDRTPRSRQKGTIRRMLGGLVALSALLGTTGLVLGASPASAIAVCSHPTQGELQNALTFCSTVTLAQGTYTGNWSAGGDVTVNGYAEQTTILNGNQTDATFTNNGHTVFLNRLTITNGLNGSSAGAGGIVNMNGGTLNLSNVNVTKNMDTATNGTSAGGIYNDGTLNITNQSSVTHNVATGEHCNGGVFNTGTGSLMTIGGNSLVSQNTCTGFQGSGGIGNDTCATLEITNSSVTSNSAPDFGEGGGIWSDGYLYMYGVSVTGNVAGSAGAGGSGGGIYITTQFSAPCARDGVATIVGGLVANNRALDQPGPGVGSGGAIFVHSAATLDMSGSGGVDNNYVSECGGGIYVQSGGGGMLSNTTIQGNDSNDGPDSGGGIYDEAHGLNFGNPNVSISHNHPDQVSTGGGVC